MTFRKKILYIHHDDGNSGASRSLAFLLDKLDPEKYQAELNCIFSGPVLNLFEDKPVKLVIKRGIFPFHGSTVTGMTLNLFLRNFVRIPQTLFTSYIIIKKHKPDLIHLNSSSLFMVALVSKLISRKIKVICHLREPLLKYSISAKIIKQMNYLLVDRFIAIDNYTGASMKTKNNIDIVYNAVNFNEYNPGIKSNVIREELGLNDDDLIFLYLARITKSNGALELLKVANKLTKDYPKFHFILAGLKENQIGSYLKKITDQAKDNPNIHLMKFRSNVPSLIASSNILIVPFTQPHFARSIVEASAMGKPIIGANVGGVNELIINNKTGYLYNNDNELYDYCVKLGNNNTLQFIMGNSAFEFAKTNFDNAISSKRVFEIYDMLLGANSQLRALNLKPRF